MRTVRANQLTSGALQARARRGVVRGPQQRSTPPRHCCEAPRDPNTSAVSPCPPARAPERAADERVQHAVPNQHDRTRVSTPGRPVDRRRARRATPPHARIPRRGTQPSSHATRARAPQWSGRNASPSSMDVGMPASSKSGSFSAGRPAATNAAESRARRIVLVTTSGIVAARACEFSGRREGQVEGSAARIASTH